MDYRALDDAHFYLREAQQDLERARYNLSKSGIDSFKWFDDKIVRMLHSIASLLEGLVNRVRRTPD